MYKFMSMQTGEIVPSLKNVLNVIWTDFRYYHIINLNWKYNKKGW